MRIPCEPATEWDPTTIERGRRVSKEDWGEHHEQYSVGCVTVDFGIHQAVWSDNSEFRFHIAIHGRLVHFSLWTTFTEAKAHLETLRGPLLERLKGLNDEMVRQIP